MSWYQHKPGPDYGLRWHHWLLASLLPHFSVLISFSFSFSPISLPLMCSFWCLGHLKSCIRSAMPCWCNMISEQGSFGAVCTHPPKTCMAPDWWMSSMSRPHRTTRGLTLIPGLPKWSHLRVVCLRRTSSQYLWSQVRVLLVSCSFSTLGAHQSLHSAEPVVISGWLPVLVPWCWTGSHLRFAFFKG